MYRAARVGSPHLPAELKGVLMLSHFMSREKGLFSFKLNFLDEEKISWLLNFFLVLHFIFTASSSISQLFKLMIATELKKKCLERKMGMIII